MFTSRGSCGHCHLPGAGGTDVLGSGLGSQIPAEVLLIFKGHRTRKTHTGLGQKGP